MDNPNDTHEKDQNRGEKVGSIPQHESMISMPSMTSIGSSSSSLLTGTNHSLKSSFRSPPTIVRSASSANQAESELFRRELDQGMKERNVLATRLKRSATSRWRQLRDRTTGRKKHVAPLGGRRKSVSGSTAISEAIQQRRVKQQQAKMHRQNKELEHRHMIKLFNLRKLSTVGMEMGEEGGAKAGTCLYEGSGAIPTGRKNMWKHRWLVHPDSSYLRVWYVFLGAVIGFQVIYIPFVVCFQPNLSGTGWDVLDQCLTGFFWLDIMLHFNIGYYKDVSMDSVDPQNIASKFASESHDKRNRLVMDRKGITRHYLSKWFWLDLAAAFPFDQMLSSDSGLSSEALGLFKGFRLPRLLGLLRLLRVVKMLRLRREFINWLKYSSISNVLRLARVMLVMFTLVHIFSCFWFIILSSGEWGEQNFSPDDGLDLIYSKTFYSTLLMMMGEAIGPITRDEHVFCSVMVIAGAVVMAVIFGNVAMLVSTFYADSSRYHDKMESVYQCMNHLALPAHLQDRVQRYYKFLWQQYHTLDGNTIQFVQELSSNLQLEVNLFLNASLIRNIQFLRDCSPEVVQELVLHLDTRIYMPQDYIIHKDEVGVEMYFVQRGECEVLVVAKEELGERVVKVIQAGNYFGEIALMMDSRRTASVRARTFCTLCVLHRLHFQKVLDRYKEDRGELERMIMSRYTQAGDTIHMQSVNEAELEAVEHQMLQKQMSTVNGLIPSSGGMRDILAQLHLMNTRMTSLEKDNPKNHQTQRPQAYARAPKQPPGHGTTIYGRRNSLQHSRSFDPQTLRRRRSLDLESSANLQVVAQPQESPVPASLENAEHHYIPVTDRLTCESLEDLALVDEELKSIM